MNFLDLANLLDSDGNMQNEMMVMAFAATMLATIPVLLGNEFDINVGLKKRRKRDVDDGKLGPEMFFQKFLQVLGKINVSDDEIGFQSDERRGGVSGIQNTVLDAANSGKRQRATPSRSSSASSKFDPERDWFYSSRFPETTDHDRKK